MDVSRLFLKTPPEIGVKTDIHTFAEEDPGLQEILVNAVSSIEDRTLITYPAWVKLQNVVFKRSGIVLSGI